MKKRKNKYFDYEEPSRVHQIKFAKNDSKKKEISKHWKQFQNEDED